MKKIRFLGHCKHQVLEEAYVFGDREFGGIFGFSASKRLSHRSSSFAVHPLSHV